MTKNNNYISPTHINKYMNCKYKWYYETKYTQKELSQMYQKYKADNGIESNSQFQAFARGNEFHSNYLKRQKHEQLIRITSTLLSIIIGVLICYFIFF